MDKETLRDFLRWLDTASEEELLARQADLIQLKARVHDRNVRRDINHLLRRIDEERLVRWEVQQLGRR